MKRIYFIVCSSLMELAMVLSAQQSFSNFQPASMVIGQLNFTSNSYTINQFNAVTSSCADISSTGYLAIGSQVGRILLYNQVPEVNGAPATLVLGKSNFTSTVTGCTQSIMNDVEGIAFSPDGKKLIASDGGNNRVLIWNSIPTINGRNADVVIGQTSFTESTAGVASNKFDFPEGILVTPDGRLLIADRYNNRVLIYNTIPTSNNQSADVVIGQSLFTTNAPGNAANQLNKPWGMAISASGNLLISDEQNDRVLIYNTIPTSNGASADYVIGQAGFGSTTPTCTINRLNTPVGIAVSPDGKVAISDFGNNRVVIYNSIPTTNGADADVVLGQPTFTSNLPFNGGISAQSMRQSIDVSFDLFGRLFVTGRDMNRIMVFGSVPTQTSELAISIAASSTSLCTGSPVTYSVIVSNNGTSAASNIIATAKLPYYFGLMATITNAGVYANGYWTIPSLSNGASVILTLTGTVNINVSQVLPVYANILNSQQYDPQLLNNGGSVIANISSATAPSATSITGPAAGCAGDQVSYAVAGAANVDSYYWTGVNAVVTGTSASANVILGAAGNATLSVLPSNGNCTGTPVELTVTISACAGINDNFAKPPVVTEYPNPASNVINIDCLYTIDNIQILDINGTVILERRSVNDNKINLSIQDLKNDVYLMRVFTSSAGVLSSRFVVQK